ncbi:DDE-type integrase/transposase/recombinase [Phormidium tenue FACHB-886]|nr:DDE-type integrase/transposase/recombinase [Phormidium tenue FACHB-886]
MEISVSWFVDERYIRVKGQWCYLYRGIDEDGNLVDVRLSEKRDMEAAKNAFAASISMRLLNTLRTK